jgi:hypothetical protein
LGNVSKEKENLDYENIHKVQIKGPTPKSTEINSLAPRMNKNHILENRMKITENKIPPVSSKKGEGNSNSNQPIHKEFGKTPEYLQKFKREAEEKKEYE